MIRPRNALLSTVAAVAVAVAGAGAGAAPAYAAASTTAAASPASTIPPHSVQLTNLYTNTCLDAIDWYRSPTNTGMANLFSCSNPNDVATQHWEIIILSGYVHIVLTDWPNYCLDGAEGTGGVVIDPCSHSVRQHWIEKTVGEVGTGINAFEDSYNDECLDGTKTYGVRVMPCIAADDHQWWQ
jgi:hypothetical protein